MYAIVKNNQVESIGELPTLFPQTSFPPAGPDAGWKAEHGVFEIVDGEQKDQRFYWVTPDSYQVGDGIVTRTYVNTAKILEDRAEVKEDNTPLYVQVFNESTQTMVDTTEQVVTRGLKYNYLQQIKASANSQLAPTDWMVIRKAERDVAIPTDVTTYRAGVITEYNRLKTAIEGTNSVEDLINVVGSQNWPTNNT
jgi:hypothetical protein